MKLFLITFGLIALAFAGIAIKILVKKNGEFAGTCASQSPFLNKENEPCGFCGKLPEEQDCKNPEMAKS
ncbi:membrane or secreted protein [Flavobacteriaceae bacterium]|uniref:membrane or secreted protein n=1 Tax=Candidatus Arcticimaribacter forsetii TaxID=2820661 RepID=UPI002076DF54|nr:membrane or secreted protein [Candidatus Arcticimaribacter forsetii]MDA8698896.1 membrane or secreted protein [Flavobacteriaceae bacterium]MDB2457017.1 membrane or secreted protein [Flavobacteriaceae bacterium]MDB4608591.1 membrane or secreted protein [Flavobacteriaceae bacterium]MDB4620839.1 membrane or secreted protein [Flavobacteriaceae bacterium]MDB4751040.1 membrane or secreted protein [Flavobacteriaceae bacterium]